MNTLQPTVPPNNQTKEQDYIDMSSPNPFTTRSIVTEWDDNYLILKDPLLRVMSRVAVEDITFKQSSTIISPLHLNMGWKWRN